MIGIDNVKLVEVIAHKVGNPTRGEALKISPNALTLNDILVRQLLTRYFLGNFNENEHFRFTHISNLEMNEMYNYARSLLEDAKNFVQHSAMIAQFLYSKSTHAKVKEGELYVATFEEVPFENDFVKAVGIFKSESKQAFLKVFPHGDSLEVGQEEGININKLDKGCLIFQRNKEEGYIVCLVDNSNKQNDTQYWVNDFLQITPYADGYHQTEKYIGLCKQFFTQEYPDKFEVARSDQIDLMNRSLDYFKTKDEFNLKEFSEEVINHEEVIDSFMEYKRNYEQSKNFTIDENFDINLAAVKKQAKSFKSVLKLDKNFHVYIHGRRDLLEKGFDDVAGKYFYKLYFDEEA